MSDIAAAGARTAAERLAPELGPQLGPQVEAALHAREPSRPPEQYVDAVELGGLIVNVATLAWTIYESYRRRGAAPAPEVITRTVRVELRDATDLEPAVRDRLVAVVVEETLDAAARKEP